MTKFLVNDREVDTDLPPGSALVDCLRNELQLRGTKIGCREGDCGACTVLAGELVDGQMRYQSLASCLSPLGNAAGKHIVTIEGINQTHLTAIQAAFVEENGTQCGFCTPGFILSLYGFCLGGNPLNMANAMEAVAGNVCRCTGYAAIKRAMAAIVAKVQQLDAGDPVPWMVANGFLPEYFLGIPERMRAFALPGPRAVPASGYILAGGTDLLIQDFDGAADAAEVRLLSGLEAFRRISVEPARCTIGAACTISEIKDSAALNRVIPNLGDYLSLMASRPIRNMGTVGGNLANASPLGDLCVMLMALDATLLLSGQDGKRTLRLRDFYPGYKQVRKDPDELIESVSFDLPDGDAHFSFEKTSKRVHLDMATVNSAMRIVLDRGVIRSATLAAGSLGPTVQYLERTSSYLAGKRIDTATFKEANRIAQTEIAPLSRHPGDGDYKRALLRQHLLLHLMSCSPGSLTLETIR